MELSRRNFLKGTGALAGISAMGAIGLGCSPAANEGTEAKGGKAEAPKTPAETTPTTLKEATDGKFTAKAMGHENYVYVEATMAAAPSRTCACLPTTRPSALAALQPRCGLRRSRDPESRR